MPLSRSDHFKGWSLRDERNLRRGFTFLHYSTYRLQLSVRLTGYALSFCTCSLLPVCDRLPDFSIFNFFRIFPAVVCVHPASFPASTALIRGFSSHNSFIFSSKALPFIYN